MEKLKTLPNPVAVLEGNDEFAPNEGKVLEAGVPNLKPPSEPNLKEGAAGVVAVGKLCVVAGAVSPGLMVSQQGHFTIAASLREKQPLHSQDPSLGLNNPAKDAVTGC
jgi:hypothetical protein